MAQLIKPATRFTHAEWTQNNQMKYRSAEAERQAAERLQNEADRLVDETAKRTEKTLCDVNKKFEQRLDDIAYWRAELARKQDECAAEEAQLVELVKRVEQARDATGEPLHLARQCLKERGDAPVLAAGGGGARAGRVGIELVNDEVTRQLEREAGILESSAALLERSREQAEEQLRLCRKAARRLEADHADKASAQQIDEACRDLKPSSSPAALLTDAAADIDPNSVSPAQWQAFTEENIRGAERQLDAAVRLRAVLDGVLQQTARDQEEQREATDRALHRRIQETRAAKSKLEEHLARVLKEMSNLDDTILNLQKAVADKNQPMALAQTRLQSRKERMNVEKCRDPTDFRLVEEIHEIQSDTSSLCSQLEAANKSVKALRRRQLELEEEIQLKENTLFIDDVRCKTLRASLKLHAH